MEGNVKMVRVIKATKYSDDDFSTYGLISESSDWQIRNKIYDVWTSTLTDVDSLEKAPDDGRKYIFADVEEEIDKAMTLLNEDADEWSNADDMPITGLDDAFCDLAELRHEEEEERSYDQSVDFDYDTYYDN